MNNFTLGKDKKGKLVSVLGSITPVDEYGDMPKLIPITEFEEYVKMPDLIPNKMPEPPITNM
jgi:hypothetical protein